MKRKRKNDKYILMMAWRNLVSRKANSGLSTMTLISILGISIGVAALITVLSVMGGFEQDLRNKMLKGLPHLEIYNEVPSLGFSLNDFPLAGFEETFPEAVGVEPFTQADVVVKKGRHISSATIFGVDPDRRAHLWGFGSTIVEGAMEDIGGMHVPMFGEEESEAQQPSLPGIVLGEGLALHLAANLGDEIVVLTPQTKVTDVLGGGNLSRSYVVVGKFRTDLFNYDNRWAVVALSEGRRYLPDYAPFLEEEKYVGGVAVNFSDPEAVDFFVERLAKNTKLKSKTWKQTNQALLFALKLEKFTMAAILMLIVLVAVFSISGTLMMTVYHKKGQVALLRSLGMTRKEIVRLFVAYGLTIGGVGIVLGLLLGLGSCYVIHFFQFIPLPEGVYYLSRLPVKFLPLDYLAICIGAVVLILFSAAYPAYTAARQDPTKGLRYG